MVMSEMAEAKDLLKGSEPKKPYTLLNWIFVILGVGMFVYQMFSTVYQVQGTTGQQNIHLMLSMVIVLIAAYLKKRKNSWLYLIFIILALVPTFYVQFNFEHLNNTTEMGSAGTIEQIMGVLLVIMPLIVCQLAFGWALTIVNAICILYLLFGQLLPITFGHGGYSFERIIIQLSIGLSSGVYGSYLQASLSYIWLLILFGASLQICGATGFFMEFGKWVGSKVRGGVAQTAVISSALVGTVTGSPMANAAICGVYTVPAMKAGGFRPVVAAGIEAAASTGGQIMPPVMGAAAFIMASFLGVPYAKIMILAFIPALFFFAAIFAFIFFHAGAEKVGQYKVKINKKEMLLRAPLFFIPLGLLVYFLVAGYSVMFGAFWSIIAVFTIAFLRKETRPNLRDTADGLADGAKSGCGIAITCSVLGILAVTMTMSGLGMKIPDLVYYLSGGNLVFALILGYIAGILLGIGLHTVAVYTIMALTVGPVLVQMGVPIIVAHFFILYCGVISNVTPPVAMPALVTSQLAGAPYMASSWKSWQIASSGTILPFCFIFVPALLGVWNNVPMDILAILAVLASLFCFSASFAGSWFVKANMAERGLALIIAGVFLWFAGTQNLLILLVALVLMAIALIWNRSHKIKATHPEPGV